MDEKIKCKDCIYFKPYSYWDGYGDCENGKVRTGNKFNKAMIKLVYCDDFGISENFGCIYSERR